MAPADALRSSASRLPRFDDEQLHHSVWAACRLAIRGWRMARIRAATAPRPNRNWISNGRMRRRPAPRSVFHLGSNLVNDITAAVTENQCSAISISYSFCGVSAGFMSGTMSPVFARAAAQGQSIFISAGDQGAAGSCLMRRNACAISTEKASMRCPPIPMSLRSAERSSLRPIRRQRSGLCDREGLERYHRRQPAAA